jgi:hypothetical protein
VILVIFEHDKFGQLYDKMVTNSGSTFGSTIAKYQLNPMVKYSVFALALIAIVSFIVYQARKTGWSKIVEVAKERAMGMIRGVISIKDIGRPWEFLFHTAMIWVCYFFMAYWAFKMFPDTSGLGFMVGAVSLFFGAVAFAITPGGLGLAPLFTQTVLMLYAIDSNVALSVGLITWTVQTISVIFIGVFSLGLLAIMNREPSLNEVTLKT